MGGSVVRSEREALEWSPQVTLADGPPPEELEAMREAEAREAEKRDALRKQAGSSK